MIERTGRAIPAALLSAVLLLAAATGPARAFDRVAWIEELGLDAGTPILGLPGAAGSVIGLDERRKIDSYTQTVTLAGDPGTVGENTLAVTVTRDGLSPRIEQADLDAEMAASLPAGVPMGLGPPDTRNRFGVYGVAAGRRGALSCAYGWQSVDLADRWIAGRDPGLFGEAHALSIRLRLCRTNVPPEDLAAVMRDLRAGHGTAPPRRARVVVPFLDALSAAAGPRGDAVTAREDAPVPDPSATASPYPSAALAAPPRPLRVRSRPRRRAPRLAVAGSPVEATLKPAPDMPSVPLPP